MLMVIFGAGASYDSAPEYPPRQSGNTQQNLAAHFVQHPREDWRPPLAPELFCDPYAIFGDIVKKYSRIHQILWHLRHPSNGRSVEEEIEALQFESSEDLERKRQLFSVRYYLHDLLLMITNEWLKLTSSVTNYVMLIDQIRHLNRGNEPVCLVTFNYDLLLDRALLSFGYKSLHIQQQLDSHPILKLFKPHGSVDWATAGHCRRMKTLSPIRILHVLRHVQPLCALPQTKFFISTSPPTLLATVLRFCQLATVWGRLPRFAAPPSGNSTPLSHPIQFA